MVLFTGVLNFWGFGVLLKRMFTHLLDHQATSKWFLCWNLNRKAQSVLKPQRETVTFRASIWRSPNWATEAAPEKIQTPKIRMHGRFHHESVFIFTPFHPSNKQMLGTNKIHYIKFEGQPIEFLSYCTKRGAGAGRAPCAQEPRWWAHQGFTQVWLSESLPFFLSFSWKHTHTHTLSPRVHNISVCWLARSREPPAVLFC